MGFNIHLLMGTVTREADMRTGEKGPWVRLSLDVGDDGKPDLQTVFAFGKQAEAAGTAKQGSTVVVVGRVSTRSYEKGGQRLFTTSTIANQIRVINTIGVPGNSPASDDDDVPF